MIHVLVYVHSADDTFYKTFQTNSTQIIFQVDPTMAMTIYPHISRPSLSGLTSGVWWEAGRSLGLFEREQALTQHCSLEVLSSNPPF